MSYLITTEFGPHKAKHEAFRNFWGWPKGWNDWNEYNLYSLSFWPIYHRRSTDSPPTINVQRIGRVPAAISAEISAKVGRYVDHHSADISVDTSVDTSTDTRPICRPTLGRHSADMSTDTSVECRSICRPICRSRGAQNTHDPCNLQYIGETKRRLKDRFNEHRRPIINPFVVMPTLRFHDTSWLVVTRRVTWSLYRSNNCTLVVTPSEKLVRHSSYTKEKHRSLQALTEEMKCNLI